MATSHNVAKALAVPTSILDTDLYKLSMQQAVLYHFPSVLGSYQFTHRDKDVRFTRTCAEIFKESIKAFTSDDPEKQLKLTEDEYSWLKKTCPYLKPDYLDYLKQYRYKPEQVEVKFIPLSDDPDKGRIEIIANGLWVETILWEVPLMACLSEIYFKVVDTDWSEDEKEIHENAYGKGEALFKHGCIVSEFGTRRRRSFIVQDLVVKALAQVLKDQPQLDGKLSGTSNVYLAMINGLNPIGTIAHEWFMGIAAIQGYANANAKAMDLWEEVYPNDLLIALTDTFSTAAFFEDFTQDKRRAEKWIGLRQDSGDPFIYAANAKTVYEKLGVDHTTKLIVYSDSLNLEKAIGLQAKAKESGFKASFGIGTFLTNDFKSKDGTRKSKALNMVIKLASVTVDGNVSHCVKISDELTKNTGDPETVRKVKQTFNINA